MAFAPKLALQNIHFNAQDFETLAGLESQHFWFRARNKLICTALQRYFPQINNFLEIGCGTGFVLANIKKRFPMLSAYGSDIHVTSLPYAQKRLLSDTNLFQMDAKNMPFVKQFDVIGAFDVLEHIEEDTIVLQQIHAALNDHGGVILTVPQHPWLWSKTDLDACHARRYKVNELQQKLKLAGFNIIMTSSFVR